MMRISTPEVLIASSCALICTDNLIAGIVFGSLGILGAVFRVSIENSDKQERNKREQEAYASLGIAGSTIADALTKASQKYRSDREDNEFH